MRRMSFGMTIEAFLDGSKTVTRRKGWTQLQVGQRLRAVDRTMGFKKGEKARILGVVRVVSVRREHLNAITDADVAREGFPGRDAAWFVAMFTRALGGSPEQVVTRIAFEHVPEEGA